MIRERSVGRLKAGVIGAGVFGGHHAGKYAAHAEADLVGVFDVDAARAQELAARHGVEAFPTAEALIAAVDAVTIAAPAVTHGPFGLQALRAGRHVLVEKPIAARLEDADAMVAIAEAEGLALQVGHQERFVSAAIGLFDVPETPRRIVARRLGPPSARGADVSVTLDLMTHDIDLARLLAGRAEAIEVDGRSDGDVAEARISFAGGMIAELSASRRHDARDRVMRIEYPSGVVEIDFVAKTFANATPHALDPGFAEHPDAKDSLAAGVARFIDAALGRGSPAVSGADGRAALAIALAVDGVTAASAV